MIKELRDYIRQCPLIKGKRTNIDYLGTETGEYTIDIMPSDTVITQYADGGSLRQLDFIFASKEYFGADVRTNIENSHFYEKFRKWIEQQDKERNLPNIDGVQSIECNTCGYLFDSESDKARYQIQMSLIYYTD